MSLIDDSCLFYPTSSKLHNVTLSSHQESLLRYAQKMSTTRTLARALLAVLIITVAAFLLWSELAHIAIIIVTWILATCLYRLTLHPLSRVPGPWLASLSNIWYAYHVRNGLVAQLATTLHHKYGPVVRVGPNEVWFNSKTAFKVIYSMFTTSIFIIIFPPFVGFHNL